jgi:(1->4)-alpha-D-glucan 1-alpha-D-glucosylmutase
MAASPTLPRATYRLQFHSEFTIRQAGEILDYLDALGISHVYASPYFSAGEASTHGYDVEDHNRLSPNVGTVEDFNAFAAALQQRDMGQILDFVPNHMGAGPTNRWWVSVLENGLNSPYARYFDIEWQPLKEGLENRVLLPILGDRYGRILEEGEFHLHHTARGFHLSYGEHVLPLAPRSYAGILQLAAEEFGAALTPDWQEGLHALAGAFLRLPASGALTDEALFARLAESDAAKQQLNSLMAQPAVAEAVGGALKKIEGTVGEPASFDALDALLNAQCYRLSYWRVAAEQINYRRFFDINTLVAIRPEVPEVFEAVHRLVFKLVERGHVQGLRIDHIDGLWAPEEYLERLQTRLAEVNPAGGRLYLLVEKILGQQETLPETWPVDGTTGYEFAADLAGVLLNADAETELNEIYARFAEEPVVSDLVYAKKYAVTRGSLAGDVNVLGHLLARIAERDRHARDFTLQQLIAVVRELVACFPVYRSYVGPNGATTEEDRREVAQAIREVRRRNPEIDRPVLSFAARMLLLEGIEQRSGEAREEQVRFALKFQQLCGPVMAKGVEDSAFYVYNRLAALNEVGSDLARFGLPVAEFHARCQRRGETHPGNLLATSTHDTKRSEDVRARLVALSEIAERWGRNVRQWARMNADKKVTVEGRTAPSPNEEYLLYQTLLGVWPLETLTDEGRASLIARVQEYMMKALKEAKINSSWIEPNEEWETATKEFIARVLDPMGGRKFLRSFKPFASDVAELGMVNSLAQVVLKCATPGVPDIYQGCEVWDFSLVDPDNRRPVDYEQRRGLLATLADAQPEELLADWRSGRIKLFVLQRLLQLRRERPEVFSGGSYETLEVAGVHTGRAIAFSRMHATGTVAVVAPRLTAALGFPPVGEVWKDTTVALAAGIWRDIFTGERHEVAAPLSMAALLRELPVACLIREV